MRRAHASIGLACAAALAPIDVVRRAGPREGPVEPVERQETEEDERRVIPAKDGDTIGLTTAQTNFTLEDAIVQASPRTAVIFYDHAGPHRGSLFRNVLIHVAPGTLPDDRAYWGVRGYDMVGTVFHGVEITGFGKVTPHHDEGHALYLNLAGDLTLIDCDIHDNGGQGLQAVNRPSESSLPSGPAPGTITIRRSRFRDNGFNPDRGAFQVSIFGTGQDVVLEDVEIVAGFTEREWPGGRTGGGLLIEAEAYSRVRKRPVWWRPADPPEDFEVPYTNGKVELTNVTIRARNPGKPLAQIKGCAELIVKDCTFEGGRVELDHPSKPGRDCGRIVWSGNQGDAAVFHRGQAIALAHEDFSVEPED